MTLTDLKKEAREEFAHTLGLRFRAANSGATNDVLGDIAALIDRVLDAVEREVVPRKKEFAVMYANESEGLEDFSAGFNSARSTVLQAFTTFRALKETKV